MWRISRRRAEAARALGQAARARRRVLSGNRRRPARRGRCDRVSRRAAGCCSRSGCRRAARGTARSIAGSPPSGSASRSNRSISRRATATTACRAPARSRRARRCRSAARSSRRSMRLSRRAARSPPICSKPPRPISSTATGCSRSPAPTGRIGLFDLADAGKRARRRRGRSPRISTPAAPPTSLRLFPERRACRRNRDRPDTGHVTLRPIPRSTIAAASCSRCWSKGQVQGGVAQGAGQALLEHGVYDPASGQLLAGSFMDYAMPRADDLPDIASALRPAPARTNPLGVKGVGEAGTTASLAAIMNAVADALPECPDIDMPATPERVWRARFTKSAPEETRDDDRTDPRPGLDDRRQGARKGPRIEPSAADRRRARCRRTVEGDEARGPVEPAASRDRDGQGLGHARHGLWRARIRAARRCRQHRLYSGADRRPPAGASCRCPAVC